MGAGSVAKLRALGDGSAPRSAVMLPAVVLWGLGPPHVGDASLRVPRCRAPPKITPRCTAVAPMVNLQDVQDRRAMDISQSISASHGGYHHLLLQVPLQKGFT